MGLVREEDGSEEDVCELWPENELPMSVYSRLDAGCWIHAPMGGAVGLNWQQVESVMRQMRLKRSEWAATVDALRILAAEELATR